MFKVSWSCNYHDINPTFLSSAKNLYTNCKFSKYFCKLSNEKCISANLDACLFSLANLKINAETARKKVCKGKYVGSM